MSYVTLKKAVEWGELERLPCAIKLLPNPKKMMGFHDFDQYERLLATARRRGTEALHLSPAATEDAIRLLDRRETGIESVEEFGDILDTQEATSGNMPEGRS